MPWFVISAQEMLAAAIIVYDDLTILHILGGEGLQLTTFCSSPENEFVFQ